MVNLRSSHPKVRIEMGELYFSLSAQEWRWHDGWLYMKHPEVRMEMDGSYLLGGGGKARQGWHKRGGVKHDMAMNR